MRSPIRFNKNSTALPALFLISGLTLSSLVQYGRSGVEERLSLATPADVQTAEAGIPSLVPEIIPEEEDPVMEDQPASLATMPMEEIPVEEDAVFVPDVVKLNLAYSFPEDADESNPLNSLAGNIFKKLIERDENWINSFYRLADISPEEMAGKLGYDPNSVLGLYNHADEGHDPEEPDTWTVGSFRKVHIEFQNGNGRIISSYSNAIQIMSMANVYCWYADRTNPQAFRAYAESLWEQSHSHRISLGNVYYCEGCVAKLASSSNAGELDPLDVSADTAEILCPGHIDLRIDVKIIGMEGKSNLFTVDAIGNNRNHICAEGWNGWNASMKSYAIYLSRQDWFERYGLSASALTARNPLTESEIEEYMKELPADLSPEKQNVIHFALSSVGRVPYYWGGKPVARDYGSNAFGSLTGPDEDGRILRGLDCSGYINWVYWSATGNRLPYESSEGLVSCGTQIAREELAPGDIIIRTGSDSHVVIFLDWTDDGKVICINETTGNVNNVAISVREADWPYYRRLID